MPDIPQRGLPLRLSLEPDSPVPTVPNTLVNNPWVRSSGILQQDYINLKRLSRGSPSRLQVWVVAAIKQWVQFCSLCWECGCVSQHSSCSRVAWVSVPQGKVFLPASSESSGDAYVHLHPFCSSRSLKISRVLKPRSSDCLVKV